MLDRLLNDFQRDFPLTDRPFAAIAAQLASTEQAVLAQLSACIVQGTVGRVGAIVRPGAFGASTLAAMAVPEERLAAVAALVSAHPEVNHNYEREHALNLWFVVAASDATRVEGVLRAIERETLLAVISLPLRTEYHIDLGFDLGAARGARPRAVVAGEQDAVVVDPMDRALLAVLQEGLPLTPLPFDALAARAGWHTPDAGREVIARIGRWLACGALKRFGVIVRHRALGFVANAMCVWDVPGEAIDGLGRALAREHAVTLCYRRAPAPPAWPYNLFCMIHGRDREAVEAQVAALRARHRLQAYPSRVLFSRRAFKQSAARYVATAEPAHG